MGDTGWGKAHRVVNGRPEGIILTESEAVWIRACWLASGVQGTLGTSGSE